MATRTIPQLHLGEPQVFGPLAVFPILGSESRLRYPECGAFLSEVDEDGDVNEVLVCNASDQPLLLYEGELIEGARQNRTIDQPVLVPSGVELRVSVSCVEQGRWDDDRCAEPFTTGGSAADPQLRATNRSQANLRADAGIEARSDQGAVWREVDSTLVEFGVESDSDALTDLFEARRDDLDRFSEPVRHLDGQLGALVQVSGKAVALDLVGRASVFAELLPRLADGYALQGLRCRHIAFDPPSQDAAEKFLATVIRARRRWLPTPGIGDAFRLTRRDLHGCGLMADGELIAVSAFPAPRG
jgi:hypothetical protein